jgi:hypothetical protein
MLDPFIASVVEALAKQARHPAGSPGGKGGEFAPSGGGGKGGGGASTAQNINRMIPGSSIWSRKGVQEVKTPHLAPMDRKQFSALIRSVNQTYGKPGLDSGGRRVWSTPSDRLSIIRHKGGHVSITVEPKETAPLD